MLAAHPAPPARPLGAGAGLRPRCPVRLTSSAALPSSARPCAWRPPRFRRRASARWSHSVRRLAVTPRAGREGEHPLRRLRFRRPAPQPVTDFRDSCSARVLSSFEDRSLIRYLCPIASATPIFAQDRGVFAAPPRARNPRNTRGCRTSRHVCRHALLAGSRRFKPGWLHPGSPGPPAVCRLAARRARSRRGSDAPFCRSLLVDPRTKVRSLLATCRSPLLSRPPSSSS